MDLQLWQSYALLPRSLTIASTIIRQLLLRSLQLLQVRSLVLTFVVILDSVLTTKTFGQGDTLTVILLVFTMMVLVIQETVFFYVGVSVELKTLLHQTTLINQPLYQLTGNLFRLANLVERWWRDSGRQV